MENDFFISYTRADAAWAEWIAWQLEDVGYTAVLQAWDFVPGSNFVLEMDRAAQSALRTIAVLSPSFLTASFTQSEWSAAFGADPMGARRKLVPVRVVECDVQGLLRQIVYLDLVGLDESQARERLLAGIGERLKPSVPPAFPGIPQVAEPPVFPGREEGTGKQSSDSDPVTGLPHSGMWVKLNDLFLAVAELDDAGNEIVLKGLLDEEQIRRLETGGQGGLGRSRVRYVSSGRVADAELARIRRTTRGGATETTIELTRAQPVHVEALRAGTSGMSADDLIEAGMRHYFFGEALPAALGLLESLADPGLDRQAVGRAFALDDSAAEPVLHLLVVEALLGRGHAQAVTEVKVGPKQGESRQVLIEWLEPHVYVNVEPARRRISGSWRLR